MTPIRRPRLAPYDADFAIWSAAQAALIRAGRFDEIDIENVAEEIESLGKSDRRSLRAHLFNLILHLAKLRFATDAAPRGGWRSSVDEARKQIGLIVDDSPSLRPSLSAFAIEEWQPALRKAAGQLAAHRDDGTERVDTDAAPLSADLLLDDDFYWRD